VPRPWPTSTGTSRPSSSWRPGSRAPSTRCCGCRTGRPCPSRSGFRLTRTGCGESGCSEPAFAGRAHGRSELERRLSVGKRAVLTILVAGLLGFLGASPATALKEASHRRINQDAVNLTRPNSLSLDQILKVQFGLPQGVQEILNGRLAYEWLG